MRIISEIVTTKVYAEKKIETTMVTCVTFCSHLVDKQQRALLGGIMSGLAFQEENLIEYIFITTRNHPRRS